MATALPKLLRATRALQLIMMAVITVIRAEGTVLDRVLDARHRTSCLGLRRKPYGTFHAAQIKTGWGRCQRPVAIVEDNEIVASAEQYDLAGMIDGRAVPVCGIGSVLIEPSHRDQGRVLIQTLVDDGARRGAEIALLFSLQGMDDDVRNDFQAIPLTDVTLGVTQSLRHGAPMTMVRGGEERDFAAIVAMGRVRAEHVRLHLDRDIDFVQYVITRKRLLAGLGPASARQLHFFIAEEGITAAAYLVLSVVGDTWTLEECGDRDPSGARVGALLQALIAREPVERRPTIQAWLPPGFLPPQVTIVAAAPSTTAIGVRILRSTPTTPPYSADDILYWRNDVF